MAEMDHDVQPISLLNVEVRGAIEMPCQEALNDALELLNKKLPTQAIGLLAGTKVVIANGLIQSGGLAKAEEKAIILDADKNALSLQAAEDYLVEMGFLNPGEWTNTLPLSKDNEWSCLTYQLIHEFGHLVDELSPGDIRKRLPLASSPTKYGQTSQSEAFAEAFTYWTLGMVVGQESERIILSTLHSDSEGS